MVDGRRSWRLDVLRAVAVLLVIMRHDNLEASFPSMLGTLVYYLNHVGWAGVDLFFVLSGYLVSGLLFTEMMRDGNVRIGRFLVRRGFKIYPSFYVFLALTFLGFSVRGIRIGLGVILHELLFVQNYFQGIAIHTWSLAVEEHFYLLLAISFALFGRHLVKRKVFVPLWVTLVLGILVERIIALYLGYSPKALSFQTHFRIDGLVAGVGLAYLVHVEKVRLQFSRLARWVIGGLGALAITPGFILEHSHPFMVTFGFTMMWVGALMFVVLAVAPIKDRMPSGIEKVLAYIGQHSYSIYLWHFSMGFFVVATPLKVLLYEASFLHGISYVTLLVVTGIVMAKVVEFPMLRVRERYFGDKTKKDNSRTGKASSAPRPKTRAS